MRPEFGCGIHDYVFAPADATTAGRIAYEVRASLRRWEPRVEVTDVTVDVAADDPALLYIDIRYTVTSGERPAQPRLPVLRDPRRAVTDTVHSCQPGAH